MGCTRVIAAVCWGVLLYKVKLMCKIVQLTKATQAAMWAAAALCLQP